MAKVIVRFEGRDGELQAYEVDGDVVASKSGLVWADLMEIVPGVLRPLIEGFMFALRHGPIQKLLKEAELPPMDKSAPDKNAEAIAALQRILFTAARKSETSQETGEIVPVDFLRSDLFGASEGMITRVPEYDGALSAPSIVESSRQVGPGPVPAG